MKKLILALTVLFTMISGSAAFAVDAPVKAPSLKQNMKQVGSLLKGIGRTVSDVSKNADNAIAANQMVELFHTIDTQTPHFIDSVPADQKPAALARYHELIQECINLTTQLSDTFTRNDNAGASAVIEKLLEIKELGHDTFDP